MRRWHPLNGACGTRNVSRRRVNQTSDWPSSPTLSSRILWFFTRVCTSQPYAKDWNHSTTKSDSVLLFCTAAFPLVRRIVRRRKTKQLPLSTAGRNYLSISIARLGVGAHFLPKAAVPLLPIWSAPLLDLYLEIEWGPYPTDVLRSVRTASNRLASAPAIISLDQSAGSLAKEAGLLLRDVTRWTWPTSRGNASAPDVSLPSLTSRPYPRLSLSSPLICSSRAPIHTQARFYLLFRAAKSAARRTHVPLRGRRPQRWAAPVHTSASLNMFLWTRVGVARYITYHRTLMYE